MFTDCTPESSIRFFVVSDGGHTWPGSPVLKGVNDPSNPRHQMMAMTTYEVDATAAMWAFFRGYALTERDGAPGRSDEWRRVGPARGADVAPCGEGGAGRPGHVGDGPHHRPPCL